MRRPEPGPAAWRSRRRSAASGLLLTAGLLAAGCSAGQAQTAKEQPANDAASADVGSLSLRDMALAYPSHGRYARGDDARLNMVTNNDLMTADALVEMRADAAKRVAVSPAEVEIAPDSAVSFLGSRPSVTLVGLTRSMWPAENVRVTFRFARAGSVTATVAVAVPIAQVSPAPTAEPSTIPGAGPD